jgi:hypothetical protein
MQQAAMREALLLYVECLKVGKFSKRRWNDPVIDETVYDFTDSDLPPSLVGSTVSTWEYSRDMERATLPKAGVSGEVLSSLRQWWTSLRSKRAA